MMLPPMVLWLSLGVGLQLIMSRSCPLVLSCRAHQRALWTTDWRRLINRKGELVHWPLCQVSALGESIFSFVTCIVFFL